MTGAGEFRTAAVVRAIRAVAPPGMGDFAARKIAAAAIEAAGAGGVYVAQAAIAEAFRHALKTGAPGIADTTREAIVISAMVRVRDALGGAS